MIMPLRRDSVELVQVQRKVTSRATMLNTRGEGRGRAARQWLRFQLFDPYGRNAPTTGATVLLTGYRAWTAAHTENTHEHDV